MRKFLANENIPLATIFRLRKEGFDISSISLDAPSITDSEVMQIAADENRTIITFDRDYGELIYKYGFRPPAGVHLPANAELQTRRTGRTAFEAIK